MTDREIDQLLRGADPYAARVVDLLGADEALLEEIVATGGPALRPVRSLRSRLVGAVAVAAALTAVIGVPVALSTRADDRSPGPQARPSGTVEPTQTTQVHYTAAVVAAARRNPRLLVTAPGWRVVNVDGFLTDEGDIVYQKGDRFLKLSWQSADLYPRYRANRTAEYRAEQVAALVGTVTVYVMGPTEFEAVVPPDGDEPAFARLRASGDRAEIDTLLASLRRADVPTWLASLPPQVVTPAHEDAAIAKVLDGVPLPPGLDAASLPDFGTNSEYQLAAQVLDHVLCGWVQAWDSGDRAKREAAVRAIGSSRTWPVLKRMDAEGDYPEWVWEVGDRITADQLPQGFRESLDCASH